MSFPSRLYNDVFLNHVPIEHVATRGCLHPRAFRLTDSCGVDKTIIVDCGHCDRCADESREHWASRMYLHLCSDDNHDSPWKYAYFVTLTYGTYDLHGFKKHPFLEDWFASYPVLDNDNYTGRFGYTPSVLVTRHIQNYFKRLRKSIVSKYKTPFVDPMISYVYSGEYGSTYGRPHWHTIIYCNVPLTQQDVTEAWGYNVREVSSSIVESATGDTPDSKMSFFPIGRVDFNDLYANGTLSDHINIDGKDRDSKFCFTYVAKYCRKEIDLSDKVLNRFAQIYYTLPITKEKRLDRGYLSNGPFKNTLYNFACANRDFQFNNKYYYDITFQDFCKIFAPKFSSSTSYGIGKQYFLANCKRFASGDFSLPSFRNRPLVFPRYFAHLLSLYRCPVYYEKACLSGKTFAKGDLQAVRDYFIELRSDPFAVSDSLALGTSGWQNGHIGFTDEGWINRDYIVLHKPDITVRCVFDIKFGSPVFSWYVYSKSGKTYQHFCDMPLDEFCEYVINILDAEIKRSEDSVERLQQVLQVFDVLVESDAAQQEIQAFEARRARNNARYRASHYDIN